jgi:two-component system response regulator BaeR
MARLLLADNDDILQQTLVSFLRETHEVKFIEQLKSVQFGKNWKPDVILVPVRDLKSASDLITKIRREADLREVAIIAIVESKASLVAEELVDSGCDIVVSKPVDFDKLSLSIRALVQRIQGFPELTAGRVVCSGIEVDLDNQKVFVRGKEIKLTPLQVRLLLTFIRHPEKLLEREWLRRSVWSGAMISPRSIDAHISKLKRTIPLLEERVTSVYGRGYVYTRSVSKKAVS